MAEKLVRTRFKPTRKTFITEWRKHRGYTLEELAEIVGCTAGAISNIERMTSGYTQGMLEALANALHCEPADLISRTPEGLESIDALLSSAPQETHGMVLDIAKRLLGKAA